MAQLFFHGAAKFRYQTAGRGEPVIATLDSGIEKT